MIVFSEKKWDWFLFWEKQRRTEKKGPPFLEKLRSWIEKRQKCIKKKNYWEKKKKMVTTKRMNTGWEKRERAIPFFAENLLLWKKFLKKLPRAHNSPVLKERLD